MVVEASRIRIDTEFKIAELLQITGSALEFPPNTTNQPMGLNKKKLIDRSSNIHSNQLTKTL